MSKILNKTKTVNFLNSVQKVSSFSGDFENGEGELYIANLRQVAKLISESTLPEDTNFRVTECEVYIVKNNEKEICLYSIFMDTFYNKAWACKGYCEHFLNKFKATLKIAEQFMS